MRTVTTSKSRITDFGTSQLPKTKATIRSIPAGFLRKAPRIKSPARDILKWRIPIRTQIFTLHSNRKAKSRGRATTARLISVNLSQKSTRRTTANVSSVTMSKASMSSPRSGNQRWARRSLTEKRTTRTGRSATAKATPPNPKNLLRTASPSWLPPPTSKSLTKSQTSPLRKKSTCKGLSTNKNVQNPT